MQNIFSLEGKLALVTGGSRGLGRVIAEGLAAHGAKVIMAARDKGKLTQAADELTALGYAVDIEAFDLLDKTAVSAAIPKLIERHGNLDILINNAGICMWSALLDSTLEDWEQTLAVNMTSVYLLCREAARHMVQRKQGRIINVSSYVATVGRERLSAYVASKHGVTGLTKSLAGELGRHNVTVNGIAPGFFISEMSEPVRQDPDKMKIFTNAIAMGRWGDPQELIGAAVFLSSEAASYVNGHTIHVDGGVANALSIAAAISS